MRCVFEAGTIISGKYRIDRVIGRGGMGIVAIATHLQLDQQFAIKVLHEQYNDDTSRERLIREARTPMRLKSDNVCRVHDVGTLDNGAPYIVMELLAGNDLASLVAQHPLPIHVAVDYVLQAMIAIAEAHALGIVHRDLKPANLFVTRRIDGTPLVKVLDFGIAKAPAASDNKLTHTTAVMGSPGYMSPEQLRSARDVDARTDIWALGVILYELVSGRVPFPATSVTELAMKVAVDPPAPLDIAPAYRAVVWRCLEKDLARRYQDVAALARDLAPFGSPGAAATAALIARLLHANAPPPVVLGNAATMPSAPPQVRGDAATIATLASAGTTLGNAAGSRTMPTASAPVKRAPWLAIGGGVLALGAAAIVGGVVASHRDGGNGSGSGGVTAIGAEPVRDAARADATPAEVRDFGVFAGQVEAQLDAGHCDRARALVASYTGPFDVTPIVADIDGCVARTAAANASRAADLIGHPPALQHPPAHAHVPADAGADAPRAGVAPVDDPQLAHQFDTFLMNGRCTAAAKVMAKIGITADRSARLTECTDRQNHAIQHPEEPDSETYIVGLAADSPIDQGTKLKDSAFFTAVMYHCNHHDAAHARKLLKYVTEHRDQAIDYCRTQDNITIP
jgi:serine/threonine-protein kinase